MSHLHGPVTHPPTLDRSIGFVAATAMVVGTIIGASIFVQPSVITARVPSVSAIAITWLLAGALTLVGALVAAELASALPRSGGVYVFLTEAWGPWLGFLWGWAMFWSMHSGILAAIAVVFARYVGVFVPLGPVGLKVVAATGVVAVSLVNVIGVKAGARVQSTLTAAKVGAVLLIVAAAWILGPREAVAAAEAAGPITAGNMLLAIGAGLFAFGGWHMVTYAADETVTPERTIPRSLVAGVLIVTVCYVALNLAYLHVLPLSAVRTSRSLAADAANAILGSGGAALAAGIVVVSTLGALNGIALAGPRVYYAMANDRLLFSWLGNVHATWRTPHRAIAIQAVWTVVLVITGSYESLFSRVIYTEWIFFALMALGLMRLRSRPDYAPRFRIAGYPVLPLLFAAASLAVAAGPILNDTRDSLWGLGLVAAGLPVYWIWRNKVRK